VSIAGRQWYFDDTGTIDVIDVKDDWDLQIERDIREGRHDKLLLEAIGEIKAGKSTRI
jgi:uncharacterized protein YciU (UPF0263 family)